MRVLNKTQPIQKVDDLSNFLKTRNMNAIALSEEIEALSDKLKKEAKEYKRTPLFTWTFTETLIHLIEQVRDHHQCGSFDYPESGLFLRGIEIAHREYIGNISLNYNTNIVIIFQFNDERFNNYFSLSSIFFDDECLNLRENTRGVGFDISFVDKEKYLSIKDSILEVQNSIEEAQAE